MRLEQRKWPHTRHREGTLAPLGRDEQGHWFVLARGRLAGPGDAPGEALESDILSVTCIREDRWWCPFWSEGGDLDPVRVDVTTPPRFVDGDTVVRMVDLALDVVQRSDRRIEVVHEEEFSAQQRALHLPDAVIEGARNAVDEVRERMRDGIAPFGDTAARWLALAREQREA